MARLLALLLAAAWSAPLPAQSPATVAATSALPQSPQEGPAWAELPPAQQVALAPLRAHWRGLDADRKKKWLAVAQRFPGLPPQEQQRVQARMTQWAAMSPGERGHARQSYQELRNLPAADRQALWEAYRALPPEERQALARRGAPSAPAAAADSKAPPQARRATPAPTAARATGPVTAPPAAGRPPRPSFGAAPKGDERKRAVPVNPQPLAVRPVTPTAIQVKPGATTTLMNKSPSPPLHNQPGLPKITATPGFVDPDTLLPNRGPQGAATIRVAPQAPAARTPLVAPRRPAPDAKRRPAAASDPS